MHLHTCWITGQEFTEFSSYSITGCHITFDRYGLNIKDDKLIIPIRQDLHMIMDRGQEEFLIKHFKDFPEELRDRAIDKLNEELNPYIHKAALEAFGKLRDGETISESERLFIIEDLAGNTEKSALAELSLSREGFKTFQKALDRLGVKSVRVEDYVVHLENEKESNFFKKMWGKDWVKEHAKKLGVSAGISTAVVGAIALFGGPVSWVAIAGGVAGGTAGRLIGEWRRNVALNKDGLNDKVAEDLLSHIYKLKTEAVSALEESDPEKRAQIIGEILKGIDKDETDNTKNYKDLEKKYSKVKAYSGLIGSVAGAGLGAWALMGAEFSSLMDKAAEEGVRLDLDGDGYSHLVKENADGAWRSMIDQNDPDRFRLMLADKHGEAFADAHWEQLWSDNLAVVTDAGKEAGVSSLSPDQLKELANTQWFHIGNPADQMGEGFKEAVREHLNQQINVKTAAVISSMAGAAIATEGVNYGADYYKSSSKRLKKHDRPLIHELEAEAIRGGWEPEDENVREITPPPVIRGEGDKDNSEEKTDKEKDEKKEPRLKIGQTVKINGEKWKVADIDEEEKGRIRYRLEQGDGSGKNVIFRWDEQLKTIEPVSKVDKNTGKKTDTSKEKIVSEAESTNKERGSYTPSQIIRWPKEGELEDPPEKSHEPERSSDIKTIRLPDNYKVMSRADLMLWLGDLRDGDSGEAFWTAIGAERHMDKETRGDKDIVHRSIRYTDNKGVEHVLEGVGTSEGKKTFKIFTQVDDVAKLFYANKRDVEGFVKNFLWHMNRAIRDSEFSTIKQLDKAKEVEEKEEKQPKEIEAPDNFKVGEALWHGGESDEQVVVEKYLGERDGRQYVKIEGSDTGIPLDEIVYTTEERSSENLVEKTNTPEKSEPKVTEALSIFLKNRDLNPDSVKELKGYTVHVDLSTIPEGQATRVRRDLGLDDNVKIKFTIKDIRRTTIQSGSINNYIITLESDKRQTEVKITQLYSWI